MPKRHYAQGDKMSKRIKCSRGWNAQEDKMPKRIKCPKVIMSKVTKCKKRHAYHIIILMKYDLWWFRFDHQYGFQWKTKIFIFRWKIGDEKRKMKNQFSSFFAKFLMIFQSSVALSAWYSTFHFKKW